MPKSCSIIIGAGLGDEGKGHYTDIGEYQYPRAMRNLIEKIAVWYELRYPSYEVNKLMPGSSLEDLDINCSKLISDTLSSTDIV